MVQIVAKSRLDEDPRFLKIALLHDYVAAKYNEEIGLKAEDVYKSDLVVSYLAYLFILQYFKQAILEEVCGDVNSSLIIADTSNVRSHSIVPIYLSRLVYDLERDEVMQLDDDVMLDQDSKLLALSDEYIMLDRDNIALLASIDYSLNLSTKCLNGNILLPYFHNRVLIYVRASKGIRLRLSSPLYYLMFVKPIRHVKERTELPAASNAGDTVQYLLISLTDLAVKSPVFALPVTVYNYLLDIVNKEIDKLKIEDVPRLGNELLKQVRDLFEDNRYMVKNELTRIIQEEDPHILTPQPIFYISSEEYMSKILSEPCNSNEKLLKEVAKQLPT